MLGGVGSPNRCAVTGPPIFCHRAWLCFPVSLRVHFPYSSFFSLFFPNSEDRFFSLRRRNIYFQRWNQNVSMFCEAYLGNRLFNRFWASVTSRRSLGFNGFWAIVTSCHSLGFNDLWAIVTSSRSLEWIRHFIFGLASLFNFADCVFPQYANWF